MKSSILTSTIAAIAGLCTTTFGEEKPVSASSASSSVITNSDGTATVTLEVNGKRETRTFKLGEEPLSLKLESAHSGRPDRADLKGKETFIGIGLGGLVSEAVRAQLPLQPGEGVSVSHVMTDSPAAKAGIELHDILVRLNDQVLVTADQFKALVKMHKPGETVKIGFFRKGERKETNVTLTEHEVTDSARDVIRLLADPHGKWEERVRDLKGKTGLWREKLKEAKDMFPGVVVDKRAFVLGVDGTVKKIEGELEDLENVIRNLAEQLEKANIPKETIDQVRHAVETAIEKTGDTAAKAAINALENLRSKKDRKLELEVKPAPSAPPVPPPPPLPPVGPAPAQ